MGKPGARAGHRRRPRRYRSAAARAVRCRTPNAVELVRALRDLHYPEAFTAYEKLRRARVA